MRTGLAVTLLLLTSLARAEDFPRLVVDRDDVAITRTCSIAIAPGAVIADANGDGVIHVRADGVTVRFAEGSVLRGAPAGTAHDALAGTGIAIEGRRGVVIEGARIEGYKVGIAALRADGLVVRGARFQRMWRQRLKSTLEREDNGDWLFPHGNDERKWRDQYGGAVCVEASRGVVIREVVAREGQNGVLLDRVTDSAVFDCDCSFLSGWGIAMWRCERDLISRNALDFCVRGHVERVYNRGQDSAGLLMFEQCNENVIAENSITHGGDGVFAFAGHEAIGEPWLREQRAKGIDDAALRIPLDVARRHAALGCDRNLFVGNDLSYSAAHGLELTFSEQNHVVGNRLVENAICGVWGGYSSDSWIVDNEFARNGGMAYGFERGAIDAEHAADLRIIGNTFDDDRCGVHLWWDEDPGLRDMPGALHDRPVAGNVIANNVFRLGDGATFGMRPEERQIALHLRDAGSGNVRENRFLANSIHAKGPRAQTFSVPPGAEPEAIGDVPVWRLPERWRWGPEHPGTAREDGEPPPARAHPIRGRTRPGGARAAPAGRAASAIDEWGPWDHRGPLVRPYASPGGMAWDVRGVPELATEVVKGEVQTKVITVTRGDEPSQVVLVTPKRGGLIDFTVRVKGPGLDRELAGTLLCARWEVTVFPWTADPRTDLERWRAESRGDRALAAEVGALELDYGLSGPRDIALSPGITRDGPDRDRFGTIARATLALPAARWRFKTTSDDGVRVLVGGKTLIENWTQHGPTDDLAVLDHPGGEVAVVVEHFELDGYAVLRLAIERAP